jgi:hypothetical protein
MISIKNVVPAALFRPKHNIYMFFFKDAKEVPKAIQEPPKETPKTTPELQIRPQESTQEHPRPPKSPQEQRRDCSNTAQSRPKTAQDRIELSDGSLSWPSSFFVLSLSSLPFILHPAASNLQAGGRRWSPLGGYNKTFPVSFSLA